MKIDVMTNWTVGDLIENQQQQILRVNSEYQRGLRWTDIQKRMFIDSIFRGYSIPAFYFHKRGVETTIVNNTHFDIVDGQQRIDAIYNYSEGAFPLIDPQESSSFRFPNFIKDHDCPWAGKRYGELGKDLQDKLRSHSVVVYEISTDNENSIRDLFIRLQGGTPLSPQDKRDSWPGDFTDFVLTHGGKSGVEKWYGHRLFKDHVKSGNESKRRQLVAQLYMLFYHVRNETRFCDIKSTNIDDFYHKNVDFNPLSSDAKQFLIVCDTTAAALHNKPKIVGHYLIHVFLLVDSLLREYVGGWQDRLASALNEFITKCARGTKDMKNRIESEYIEYYREYAQHARTSSDNALTIRRRHAYFTEKMLDLLEPKKKDPQRQFTDLDRQTVFFRDMENCQWCRLNAEDHKVSWSDSEIHHVRPHSEGGRTDLANGALVHRSCHPKSKEDTVHFREWWEGLRTETV